MGYVEEALNIIIFEDEAIIAQEIEQILRDQIQPRGITRVTTMKRFREELSKNSFDLAVLDINIRNEPLGIEAGAYIRKNHEMGIVYLTAYSTETIIDQLAAIRPDAYLLKPFNETQLAVVAKQVLKQQKIKPALGTLTLASNKSGKLVPKVEVFQEALDKIFIISIFDEHGDFVYFNDSLCEFTGESREELMAAGHPLFRDSSAECLIRKNITDTLNRGQMWEGEFCFNRQNQCDRWGYSYVFEIISKDHTSGRYFICIGNDITGEKQYSLQTKEQLNQKTTELARKQREMASLLKESTLSGLNSILMHEIKRPLVSIAMQLGMKMDGFRKHLPPNLFEHLHKTYLSVDGTSDLILYLNTLFKRKADEPFEEFDLSQVLESVLNFSKTLFPYNGISFQITTPDHKVEVSGFPDILFISILNLVKNACEAFPTGQMEKHVELLLEDAEHHWVILVRDNKIAGIPPEIEKKLFTNENFTSKPTGSGLGLNISASILGSMNAKIELLNTGENGSTFLIRFPKVALTIKDAA